MAGTGDIGPPPPFDPDLGAPDLASLQYPWSVPPPDAAAQLVPTQPGIGIPASAFDGIVPPAPALGPPTADQALAGAGQAFAGPPPAAPAPGPAPVVPPAALQQQSPPPFGPPAPGMGDLAPIITEPSPAAAARADELAHDPLAMRPGTESATGTGRLASAPAFSDEEAEAAMERMAVNSPTEYAAYKAKWQAAKDQQLATRALEASTANRIKAQENADAYNKAWADAQAKASQLEADWKELAAQKIDPDRWMSSRSPLQKVAAFAAAIVGGLVQGRVGGPNIGLQQIQKSIDEDVAAQQAEMSNRRSALGARQSAVAEMFARTGDMYHATEAARGAAWEATIQQLQAEQQKYDPRGTTVMRIADTIQQARAQQAGIQHAYGQQQFKNGIEAYKVVQEDRKLSEQERKDRAEEEEKLLKLSGKLGLGGGAGSTTNPSYTVPSGFWNPFDPTQQIMGKRQIGGKGEDAKERKDAGDLIGIYSHVQDYWAKLAAIGGRIDYAKSAGESIWKARRGTLESEYDAAKEALTVYLTKELKDKLTQGQLDLQAHRIPDRASVFEAREPGKQISAAQEDSDRDFARDMDLIGLDATPVIRSAQQHRMVVTPSAIQELDAAHAAAAANPEDKDAQRELAAAEQRQRDEVSAQQQRAADTKAVREGPPPPDPLPEESERPPAEVAAVKEANRAGGKLTALLSKFWAAAGDTSYRKGLKPGEVTAADRAQDAKVGSLAGEVVRQRALVEELRTKAQREITKRTTVERAKRIGMDPEEAAARLRTGVPLGDEAAPAPAGPPPNPLVPNATYLPGADPFGPPVNADVLLGPPAPSKKGKKR